MRLAAVIVGCALRQEALGLQSIDGLGDRRGPDAEDGQTPGQLATRLGVRPPTITKTINRLQAQGFLAKRASDNDGRQAHIYLTETGSEAIREIEKSVRKAEKQALKGLDKKELKVLSKMLSRIEANLSGSFEQPDDDESDEDQE